MLLLTALSLVFRAAFVAAVGADHGAPNPAPGHRVHDRGRRSLGVLVTISSVGAGALGVTALLLLYPAADGATIVGSDIAHAVPLTLVAGIGHWWMGSTNWGLLMWLLAGSVPGIVLGSYMAVRVPDAVLRPVLAATLAVVAGQLIF